MKKLTVSLALAATAGLLAALPAAFAQSTDKSVAFKTADGKYVTTAASSTLDLSGTKAGSKQSFTLTDVNGGELADGDEVKIAYLPNPKGGEAAKPNYWRETKDGVKRGGEAGVFKLKKVGEKYAFQAAGGKFVGMPGEAPGALPLVDAQEGALTVEIVPAAASAKPAAAKPDAAKPADE